MSDDIVLDKINKLYSDKIFPEKYKNIILNFYISYKNETKDIIPIEKVYFTFITLIDLMVEQFKSPYIFDYFNKKVTTPFDFYSFGKNFIRPLVDFEKSTIFNLENLKKIKNYLEKNENVILLSNHQSEIDPHAISLLLEKDFEDIASKMIYVAGERVIQDPLAIPFSMGCNLLCIFSKRYIDIDQKLQHQKLLHNKKVMSYMSELLSEGGKIIYVAPSGGRDRKNQNNEVEVAPFDPQSVEMLNLMSKKSKKPTHFFLLTLATYDIAPPPEKVQKEMGENRSVKRCPIFLSFSSEVDMEKITDSITDKHEKRKVRAKYLQNIVKEEYKKIASRLTSI